MAKNENNLMKWLRRIFSIQTLAVVATAVGSYYAYKSYNENKSSNISIEMYDFESGKMIDIEETPVIYVFYSTKYDSDYDFIDEDLKYTKFLPNIQNKSTKSLKNFRCTIDVETSPMVDYEEDENGKTVYDIEEYINKDYSIVDICGTECNLKYKDDVLRAHTILSPPLNDVGFQLFDNVLSYCFYYNITYDGLEKPISLIVWLNILDFNVGLENGTIKGIMSILYDKLMPDVQCDDSRDASVVFTDGEQFHIVKNIKSLKEEEINSLPFDNIKELKKKLSND